MKKHLLFKFLLTFSLALFTVGWVNGQGVFISQNCDPQANYAADRFAEIYNPTASAVDLTGWTLENVQGGSVQFTWTLSGTIASGEALICGNADNTDQTITPDFTATWVGISWNGKGGDGTILKNGSGTIIDYAVQVDPVTFENKEMVRNSDITSPNTTYTESEWTFSSVTNAVDATPGTHTCILPATSPLISNITRSVQVVQATDAVTITADINPNGQTINVVLVNYGTVSGSLSASITMTNTSGNTWTSDSDIPAQVEGTTIFYEIEVAYNSITETLLSGEENYTVVAVTEVSDLATLRAGATDGTIYKLTGEAILTFKDSYNNQKYIQDATAGILIYDAAGKITTDYNIEDGITGIIGTLTESNGMLRFIPSTDPGAANSTGNTITPVEVTINEYNTNFNNYEAEVVKLVDVYFDGQDGTNSFANGQNYNLSNGSETTVFRTNHYNLDYTGTTIPHSSINTTIVGVAFEYNGTAQVCSRNAADMTIPDYIVITSPAENDVFDTETNVTVDFVTYNQTDLLKLQVWVPDPGSWIEMETDIDPAAGTTTITVPADAAESSSYKLSVVDQTDSIPTSNEVTIGVNDVSGPVFNYFDPVDGATDVARNQNLVIDFNEDIKAGTGNIIVKKYDDDTEIASYDVTTASEIDITGTTLTITNGSDWPNETMMYVEIAAGVILDLQDNADFSVVKDDWVFTTADEVAPSPTFDPADAATDVARNAVITISFDEAIYAFGPGTTPFDNTTIDAIITLNLTDAGGAAVPFDATINGTYDVITITPNTLPLTGLTDYYFAISNLYEDAAGNQGSASNATFTTADATAPIATFTPANASIDIARNTNITITFDQAVRKLDDSEVVDADLAAMITLKETDGSGADVAFTASINVAKTEITIDPTSDLKANQLYFVEIANQLESEFDKQLATTNVTFTTIDDEAPIATFDPADAETDVAISSNIIITMHEAIVNTDASVIDDSNVGNLITLKDTDGLGTDIAYTATIDAEKKVITIDPDADLDYIQDVYVAIAAVEDAAGNESALQTATFTTIANDDATLSDLTIDGETVDGFDAATLIYNVTVPFGTDVVPTVAAVENDPDANAVVTQATNLDGTEAERTATVIVTAENTTTTLTYEVIFELGPEGDLFFSEYIEGSSSNRAIEIYNPTGASIDLSDYTVKQSHNGSGWGVDGIAYILPLSGTLASNDVYVIAHDDAYDEVKAEADLILAYSEDQGAKIPSFTGDDALGLFKNDVLIDVIGIPEERPDIGWDIAGTPNATVDHTLLRKYGTFIGNTDWASSAGTTNENSEWKIDTINYIANIGSPTYNPSEANIIDFSFESGILTGNPIIDNNAATVSVTTIFGSDLSDQTAVLKLSTGASTSDSYTDFTNPVTYTVEAEDGTTKVWTVTCTVSSTQSSEAEIKKAVVSGADSIIISSNDATVKIYTPYEFDETSVTPEFTLSAGASIDKETAQNFTVPVVYVVTAQDGTTEKEWTVSVEKQTPTILSIYNIQYTEEASGDSPYEGELIKTSGIVTATNDDGFFIQDGTGAWNGIYVYNSTETRAIGDDVEVTGYIVEDYNLTRIEDVAGFEFNSSNNDLPAATEITTLEGQDEDYESIIVTVDDAKCTDPDMGYGMFEINDGSGALLVDDVLYAYTADSLAGYDITGIAYYSYSERKILLRDASDITLVSPVIGAPTLDPTTPTSSDEVTITASITDNDNTSSELTNKLYYGSTEGSEDTEVTFAETSTADQFEGTIPASSSTVYYKITASDGTFDSEYTGSYSVATGINNPDGIVSMNIFPNPSNGLFTIEMNASKAGTFNVEIINIQGQVVYNKEITQDGFYKDQIDITKEASGIYYIRINDGKDMKVSKIMIQ